MGKQYNTELQAKVETYMKETGISQAKLAPMMNLSGAVLSQYRRSVYDKGDVGDVERKLLRRTGECFKRSFWSFKNIFKQG